MSDCMQPSSCLPLSSKLIWLPWIIASMHSQV